MNSARYSFSVGKLGQEVLPHPSYSPDLASSDYPLSGPMKKILGGQKFASDTEMQSTVRQWLRQQPTSYFCIGHSETCRQMG